MFRVVLKYDKIKPNTVCEVIFCALFIALIVKTKGMFSPTIRIGTFNSRSS